MMEKFKQLLMEKAKKGKFLDEKSAERKIDVLNEMDELVDGAIGNKLRGLKKITVASDSEEGLKEGLEKAKETIEKSPKLEEICDESEDESEEKMTQEEIKAKIRELQDLLEKEEE